MKAILTDYSLLTCQKSKNCIHHPEQQEKPVVPDYTEKDLNTWTETIARGLTMMGIGKDDILRNTHGYGMYTGGFGIHYGYHKVGATIIPIST